MRRDKLVAVFSMVVFGLLAASGRSQERSVLIGNQPGGQTLQGLSEEERIDRLDRVVRILLTDLRVPWRAVRQADLEVGGMSATDARLALLEESERGRDLPVHTQVSILASKIKAVEKHLQLPQPFESDGDVPALDSLQQRYENILTRVQELARTYNGLAQQLTPRDATKPPGLSAPSARVLVVNRAYFAREIVINGQRYRVDPGSTAEIPVSYGIVQAYLPGFEFPKYFGMTFWQNNGDHYVMRFQITS